LDTGLLQQLAEQQSRRTGADDGDLSFQRFIIFMARKFTRTDKVKELSLVLLLTFFT